MAPPSPTILAKATKEELLNKLSEARIKAGLPEETERLKDLNKDELIRELVLVQHGAVSEGGAQALKEEEPSGRKSDSSEVMLAMVMKLMQDQQEWQRTLLEVLRETEGMDLAKRENKRSNCIHLGKVEAAEKEAKRRREEEKRRREEEKRRREDEKRLREEEKRRREEEKRRREEEKRRREDEKRLREEEKRRREEEKRRREELEAAAEERRREEAAEEALQQDKRPLWPGEAAAADLCNHAGKEYLVIVDKWSGWCDIYCCGRSASTEEVVDKLQLWSSQLGVARRLTTDGGPQFKSKKFADFCVEWGIKHDPSSPHHHESNGYAEAAVKSMKNLLRKTASNGDIRKGWFLKALLEWRNTPGKDGLSPAQKLFGRRMRSLLPSGPAAFRPEVKEKLFWAEQRGERIRQKANEQYDESAKDLQELRPGKVVLIQQPSTKLWDTLGEVIRRFSGRRSYLIKTETGRLKWRNRRFLRPYIPPVRFKAH
eukprot:TRINITY_DN3073_c0_g1_i5.p1 TRINITY_DN3073_c0_g1~~TRINITY_DN3073_c0_g1_i5.p1  ORF type:complete len:487 (-),score=50.01 TRINITY_DN3073_c0_g1_i5:32-1492(-)